MQVLLDRKWRMPDYTIGEWIVDGEVMCNTMEDTDRGLAQWMDVGEITKMKIYGKTAIPTGFYKITMTYSPKYKRVMPQIMNVKGYAGVRVHSGNISEHTLGCVLLGFAPDPEHREWVGDSRECCKKFEEMLVAAGGTCDLEIR